MKIAVSPPWHDSVVFTAKRGCVLLNEVLFFNRRHMLVLEPSKTMLMFRIDSK